MQYVNPIEHYKSTELQVSWEHTISQTMVHRWEVLTDPKQENLLYCFKPPKELWEAYSHLTVRPTRFVSLRCISPIFFQVGIPNLVCVCIFGWRSVVYHLQVTVTLTPDLVSRNCIESGAYLLYRNFQIWCANASWDDKVSHIIFRLQ